MSKDLVFGWVVLYNPGNTLLILTVRFLVRLIDSGRVLIDLFLFVSIESIKRIPFFLFLE